MATAACGGRDRRPVTGVVRHNHMAATATAAQRRRGPSSRNRSSRRSPPWRRRSRRAVAPAHGEAHWRRAWPLPAASAWARRPRWRLLPRARRSASGRPCASSCCRDRCGRRRRRRAAGSGSRRRAAGGLLRGRQHGVGGRRQCGGGVQPGARLWPRAPLSNLGTGTPRRRRTPWQKAWPPRQHAGAGRGKRDMAAPRRDVEPAAHRRGCRRLSRGGRWDLQGCSAAFSGGAVARAAMRRGAAACPGCPASRCATRW